jgi:hypothetical protein
MGAFPEVHTCPKCGRLLVQSGEAVVEGTRLPVFQCDDCEVETNLLDETMRVPLTFTLDEDGQVFADEGWRWA